MIKKIILGSLVLLIGYAAGLVAHLYSYPQEEFATFYDKIVRENGENRWAHRRQLNDHTFTEFLRPNNDTLYSYCMVDLAKGPVVVEAPPIDTYWCIQFIAANSDTFHYVGSRIQGLQQPVRVILAARGFSGDQRGMEIVHAPTQRVWLFARILTDGRTDLARVTALQDRLKCTPLSRYKPL